MREILPKLELFRAILIDYLRIQFISQNVRILCTIVMFSFFAVIF